MQTFSIAQRSVALAAGAIFSVSAFVASAAPRIQTGPTAEVTQDGLHRVDGATLDRAWAKPGVDLSGYTKVMLVLGDMQFRDVKDPGLRRNASDFPLDEKQKRGLESAIEEAFITELGKSTRFTLVNEAGPGVLEIRGALVDVVSHVPEEPIGRGATFMKSLGEATLVVELRDSQTQELFARAVDRRAAERAFPTRSSTAANKADVRSGAQRWANLLRRRLDEFSVL
jgi:hypothetical protein